MPPKVYLSCRSTTATSGRCRRSWTASAGVKWVNAHPRNPEKHQLPTVRAVYVLSDPETASPLAIMDGTLLTAWRTGAAGGVASKYLARPKPRTLGLVGCGVQARVIDAHRALFEGLELLLADVSEAAARRCRRRRAAGW